jgi:hypothetical protein
MTYDQTTDYLNGLPLAAALWWFIENCNEDDPHRSELFFYLRERVRNHDPKQEFKHAKALAELEQATRTEP